MSEAVCPRSEESLGALVLGALDPAERDAVEAHVRGCPACSAVLAELAPLPGLLHRVDLGARDVVAPPELLDRALAVVRGSGASASLAARRRRRRMALAALATAAAVVAVLSFVLVQSRPASVVVTATSASTHVSARVVVTPTSAGTELALTLDGVTAGQHCQLVAVSRSGQREVAATWVADYEGQADVTGTTSVTRADLARLEVTTTDGTTLVGVDVPA